MGDWEVGQRPEWEHKLSHNKREWSPQRLLFLDTETGSEDNELGQFLPLRSWELCVVWRDKPESNPKRERWFTGTTGLELAKLLDTIVTSDKTTWLFAHNLGFDLGTTRLPVHLPRLGWQWTMGVVTGDSPWMRWKKGNRSLTAVDSFSHLPKALKSIGDAIGLPKLPMPAFDGDPDEWDTYRHRDVQILRNAVLQYLGWWDANKLGNLSVSGPASGWNCWRHTTEKLYVHIDTDADVRQWGRKAIYGGRRSSWRVGELADGPYVEIDVQRAHLNIMRNELTPIAVYGWVQDLELDHPLISSSRSGVVADCVVRTDAPRYPLLTDVGVLYPVGEFRTRLAGPELAAARDRGELVAVERGLAVALGRPMKQWADWVEAGLAGALEGLPPVAPIAMKGWSRTAVGKWAGRTQREILRAPWDDDGWRIETGYYNTPDNATTTVYGSGEMRTYIRDQEAHDSFPAAYAWITSHMRTILSRLLDYVGYEQLVACNTDSAVVHIDALRPFAPKGLRRTQNIVSAAVLRLSELMAPYTITDKHIAETVRIRTAEHTVFDQSGEQFRKVASVSKGAKETAPWVFQGETWPALSSQLCMGTAEGYQLINRRIDVSKAKPLAWIDANGYTSPPRYAIGEGGNNVFVPWWQDAQTPSGPLSGTEQHAGLFKLATV